MCERRGVELGSWRRVIADGLYPAGTKYFASDQCEPFHDASCDCIHDIADVHLETFRTYDEAVRSGHRPCRLCDPIP